MMDKILISSCLLGEKVRFDGNTKTLQHQQITQWQRQGRLISICPEVAGGLPVPRPAAEIVAEHPLRVKNSSGEDVTAFFTKGAQHALKLCQQHDIRFALLKARSPSCGNRQRYDGSFSGQLIDGMGVTAALLSAHGIEVFNENQIEQLAARLRY